PINDTSTCSVTVSDTDTGTKSAPAGSVSFASSTAGGLTASPYALTPGTTSSTCQVTYTPTAAGSHQITASYSPSGSVHDSSSDATGQTLAVPKPTTSTLSLHDALPILPINDTSTCSVTVSDTDTGTKSAPAGSVSFASS